MDVHSLKLLAGNRGMNMYMGVLTTVSTSPILDFDLRKNLKRQDKNTSSFSKKRLIIYHFVIIVLRLIVVLLKCVHIEECHRRAYRYVFKYQTLMSDVI
jgi:hypothetical protein